MDLIKPVHYRLRIEPDINSFTFKGRIEIVISVERVIQEIVLNVKDLHIENCFVLDKKVKTECHFGFNEKDEKLIISLPYKMEGRIIIHIVYEGNINNKMAGFYRSNYKINDTLECICITQFEESDARRAFPCFDHPSYKGIFETELVIDRGLNGISNTVVIEEIELERNKLLVRFKQTPIMSTYLLFFGIGKFDVISDTEDNRIRAITVRGKIKYTKYGINFARKALRFCEEYFSFQYPLSKMDLIAVPDFAFGAMENWGAITFRENLLLHYPGITSRENEKRICEVTAHEIVHQWFGNLVTPDDWKYLWLNESFATYFGFMIVDYFNSDWQIWQQFVYNQGIPALLRDALIETFPIEIPGGEHIVINTSTSPIIYSKGGCILRQMKEYIGEPAFKAGLKKYLSTYAYKNTNSSDLWKSFEDGTDIPVLSLLKSWIMQPGFPVINAECTGEYLVLEQKRFTYIPIESNQKWIIPVSAMLFYSSGKEELIKTLMEENIIKIPLSEKLVCYKLNLGQTGFYRVCYADKKNFEVLGKKILSKKLPPEDRWGIENDLFALVCGCKRTIKEYLDFLKYYKDETEYLPLMSIADNLYKAFLLTSGTLNKNVVKLGLELFENILNVIKLEPVEDENFTISVLRNKILWYSVFYGSEKSKEFALKKFNQICEHITIHPNILQSILKIGAYCKPEKSFDILVERYESSESEAERITILSSMGCFSELDVIHKALNYFIDSIPSRNKFIPISIMAYNHFAKDILWDWYRKNLKVLEALHPVHYERIIFALVPYCCLDREAEATKYFTSYIKEKKLAIDVIKLSLENLKINVQIKKNNL